jgi:hypothetical protein
VYIIYQLFWGCWESGKEEIFGDSLKRRGDNRRGC